MYGKRSADEPKVITSGALPYSLKHILRASLEPGTSQHVNKPRLRHEAHKTQEISMRCMCQTRGTGCLVMRGRRSKPSSGGRSTRDGCLGNFHSVRLCVDGADVAFCWLLVKRDVLANQNADANATEVEAIQEGMDFREL